MKQKFNPVSGETYASREAKLEAKAQAIEDMLSAPRQPSPTLKPKGFVQSHSHANARAQLNDQRINIDQELKEIRAQMEQRRSNDRAKAKTL
jgi:hypothetical protein